MLLAIDPGMNSPGVAVFRGLDRGGELLGAWRASIPADCAHLEAGMRWLTVGRLVVGDVQSRGYFLDQIRTVVFEKPQWYDRAKSKGNPNDLVGVAGVAATVCGVLNAYTSPIVHSPEPAVWIGQVPKVCPICRGKKTAPAPRGPLVCEVPRRHGKRIKAICPECNSSAWGTPRGKLIRKRLTDAEFALVPDQNDAIDAVGIGLWALGRLVRQSVFSNGRDGR